MVYILPVDSSSDEVPDIPLTTTSFVALVSIMVKKSP